jgi:plastocyanin
VGAPGAQGPGEGDAANDDAGPVTTVLVGPNADHSYLPRAVTIPVGTTVEWLWESDGHNVTSGAEGMADGLFCSPSDASCASPPTSNTGTIYRHKFTSPGTFPYFCGPHYSVGMKATITVQ